MFWLKCLINSLIFIVKYDYNNKYNKTNKYSIIINNIVISIIKIYNSIIDTIINTQ